MAGTTARTSETDAPPVARPRRIPAREWLVLAALGVALIAAAGAGQWLARADFALYDLASGIWRRAPSADVVIVAIDDPSLAAIGRWPWPRAVHATLIDRLAAGHPAAVGLDLILAEADEANPRADEALAAALARVPSVLPVYVEGSPGRLREVVPVARFRASAKALGHIDAELDYDGVARRVYLREGLGAAAWSHFALAMVQLARPGAIETVPGARRPDRPSPAGVLVRDNRFAIPFTGPPGTMRRVSYAAVLRGEVPPEAFRNRLVLVGATAAGLGDTYPTPVSGESVAMPGIEVSANVIDALLRGIAIDEAAPLTQAWLAPLLVLALLAAFLALSPRAALITTLVAVAALAGLAVLVFKLAGFWFSPALAAAGMLASYPLWSWRRLEAANRHLSSEMRRAAEESVTPLALAPALGAHGATPALQDRFVARLDAAQAAAEALRWSRRVFAQSLAGLPVAVLVCDRRELLILANPPAAALAGVEAGSPSALRHELIGDALAAIAGAPEAEHAAQAAEWRALVRETIDHGRRNTREIAAGERSLLASVAPYAYIEDVVVGAIVTLVDLTGVKRLERERAEFLQFVSHDLRSPQNSIIAIAQLARDEPASFAEGQLSRLVEGHARTTLAMIDSMLAQTRAERIAADSFVELDLVGVVQDAVDRVWPQVHAQGQKLEMNLPPAPAPVVGHAESLVRAVLNLVSNASKYSPRGSTIAIGLANRRGRWSLSVRDAGIGIPDDAIDRLFTKFYRVPRGDGADPGGTGLGLALVRTVARKHGGEVTASSEAGCGSVFTIELPAAVPPAAPAAIDN